MTASVKTKTTSLTGTKRAADTVMRLTWERCILDRERRPTMRNSHCITSLGKDVYIFGGRAKGGESNQLLCLDTTDLSRGWRVEATTGDTPSGRKSAGFCTAEKKGKLYLFGGCHKKSLLNDLYSYDCGLHLWTKETPSEDVLDDISEDSDYKFEDEEYPCARDRHSLVHVKGKLVLFGGHSAADEFLNDVWLLDIESMKWKVACTEARDALPCARYEHCAVSVSGKYMVVLGGKGRTSGLSDVHIFDVCKEKWVTHDVGIRSLPRDPCWGQSAAVFHSRIVVFGGWNGRTCFNDVHVLDCTKAPWTFLDFQTLGERPSLRTFHTAVAPMFVSTAVGSDGSLKERSHLMLVVGGRDLKKRLDDTYTLDIADLDPAVFSKKRRRSLAISDDLTKTLTASKPDSALHRDFKAMGSGKKAGRIAVRDFELSTTLGTGSFGRVRLCQYKQSGEWFAMKMLRKTKVVEMKQENHIKWEKKILSSIRHPFIVNMEAYFQDVYFLYLVLELVPGGEFFSLLRKIRTLRMPHAVFYGAQIVLVFQYLHKNKIVYRDLKPENLLIASDGYLRLTDFGFAKKLDAPYRTWTLCGTPEYIAPEILLNRGHSFSVDWWALGILLFEMFTGNPPFVDDNPMRIYQKILDGRIDFPRAMHANAKDFIGRLLAKNLTARLGHTGNGAVDVMEHPFFARVDWKRILDREVKSPYIPEIKSVSDTRHFDAYDEDTDTEDTALEMDPFVGEF